MPHAIRRIDVAGRDVTENLQMQLRKAGYHLQTTAEKEVVRMIKEKCCYIAANPVKEEAASREDEEFKLPDGNTVKVSYRDEARMSALRADRVCCLSMNSSAQSVSDHQRSSSILSSTDKNTRAYNKS